MHPLLAPYAPFFLLLGWIVLLMIICVSLGGEEATVPMLSIGAETLIVISEVFGKLNNTIYVVATITLFVMGMLESYIYKNPRKPRNQR